jgi:hypothetical protein
MRILDKHKDYYDYLAGVYGIDNTVFYDRRGSTKLTQDMLIRKFYREDADSWVRVFYSNKWSEYLNKNKHHIIIEAGYYHYLISVSNVTEKICVKAIDPLLPPIVELDGELKLIHTFDDHKHYFPSPLNIYTVDAYKSYYSTRGSKIKEKTLNYANDIHAYEKSVIENPILTATSIPSILNPHTIYTNIFDYISSKADFDIIDTRDDVAKAVDHGFDKKISFRNM